MWLAQRFLPENQETRGGFLTPVQRMETTLHYLADPSDLSGTGYGCIPDDPFYTCGKKLDILASQHPTGIKFPASNRDVADAKWKWAEKKTGISLHSCNGAIDCTHVRIDKPRGQFGDDFINRKKTTHPSMCRQHVMKVMSSPVWMWAGQGQYMMRGFFRHQKYTMLFQRTCVAFY